MKPNRTNHRRFSLPAILLALLVGLAGLAPSAQSQIGPSAPKPSPQAPPNSVVEYQGMIGSVVADPHYFFDPVRDDLNEGAIEILGTGARAIKLYLDTPLSFYPHKPDWWTGLFFNTTYPDTGLANLAQHPKFREVFNRPFDTYVMTSPTLSLRDWWLESDGIDGDEYDAMVREYYNLTKHFLTAYDGTGKTFVFSNWEGDNQLERAGDPVPQWAIDNMVRWLQARQQGVNQARSEIPYPTQTDVRVLHSAESNGWNGPVVRQIVPLAAPDLFSYSAWGLTSKFVGGDLDEDREEAFLRFNFMESHLPPLHSTAPWNEATDGKRVYLGEWGRKEGNPDTQARVIRNSGAAARDWGTPWVFYWNTYDNTCNPSPATSNSDCEGHWLRRVDGTLAPAWHVIHDELLPGINIDPPDDIAAAFVADDRVRISWSAGAVGTARIQRQQNGGSWASVGTSNGSSLEDFAVQPGTRYRYRLRLESGGLDSGWFYSDNLSQDVPFDALYSDMFRYSNKDRQPFQPLQDDVTEVGGAQWVTDIQVRWGEGETVTNVPHGESHFRAGIAVDVPAARRLQADVDVSNAAWAGLGFSSSVAVDHIFTSGQVWVKVEPTGFYTVRINGNTQLGSAGQATVFNTSDFNRVELEYDPVGNDVSLWINGVLEVDRRSLGSFVPQIAQAGFQFWTATPNTFGVVRLDNFAISGAAAAPPLQIVQQPVGQTVDEGDPASFQVAASGGVPPYGYQWQFRLAGGSWSNISGATSSTYAIGAVDDSDEGDYRCRVEDASVPAGAVLSNSAHLEVIVQQASCPPGGLKLCLDSGRFEATVVWDEPGTPLGGDAFASPHPTADNAGFFYFDFNDSRNLEIGVKVLDGSAENGYFWVFHGAITTFDYTLTVRDTATGIVRIYTKTGTTRGAGDIYAFPPSGGAAPGLVLGQTSLGQTSLSQANTAQPSVAPVRFWKPLLEGTSGKSGTRTNGSHHFCLLDSRFQVEVLQPDIPGGPLVPQPATPLSDLAGSVYFFSADNPEIFVKMLDPGPSIPWFWVFYGSMTDTNYEVHVTDTVSGVGKTYLPTGPLCGDADTLAFPKP